jgi:acyl dehydratase
MAALAEVGSEITPITKHITQEKINLFEACGLRAAGEDNFHTDPEAALQALGTAAPIASGRMQLSFAAEALRRFFGPEVFNHHGMLDLRFIKPVVSGDTVTARGRVTDRQDEAAGTRVSLEVWCENQNGDKTAIGTGGTLIPK